MYAGKDACDDALKRIADNYQEFHDYLVKHWIPVAEMFMGQHRTGILHLDNHTNNRLER